MTTATTTNGTPAAPDATPSRGMLLPCPLCGEEEARIRLDLDDGEGLFCQSCEVEFTISDVRARMAAWTRMLAWIDTMPG